MNLIEDTLAAFGRSLGMPDLRLRTNGSVVLSLQSIGTLAFDVAGRTQDHVILSLSRPLPQNARVDHRELLKLAHVRHRSALPVHVGLRQDQLVLAVVIPDHEFTLPRITEAIRLLDRRHQSAEVAV